jgi:hypothetical protein
MKAKNRSRALGALGLVLIVVAGCCPAGQRGAHADDAGAALHGPHGRPDPERGPRDSRADRRVGAGRDDPA